VIRTSAQAYSSSQAEIAYRKGDYATAKNGVAAVTPTFSTKDAEPYLRQKVESLTANLEKVQSHDQTAVASAVKAQAP
jgi:hypothetical protein